MSRVVLFFLVIFAPILALLLIYLGVMTWEENILGWFLVLVGAGYVVGGIVYAWRQRGRGSIAREERGDRSFWLILPGFLAVFYASPLEYLYLPERLPRTAWMQVLGVILIVLALGLRVWTRYAIRGMYTAHVQVVNEHRLVQEGPYRYIRHPGYAGFLLMALGIAVGYSSLLGLISTAFLLFPALVYRMRVEEKLLLEQFGDEYRQYAAKTRLLLPGIW